VGEHEVEEAIDVLVRLVESAGAIVIFAGCALGFGRFLFTAFRHRGAARFTAVRLDLGRYLALGLEFQLAGDILRSAIAPTFEEIGQLAAVAAIRTALNYFLSREISEQREEVEREESSTG
jgi:uncharacterized membrane protein